MLQNTGKETVHLCVSVKLLSKSNAVEPVPTKIGSKVHRSREVIDVKDRSTMVSAGRGGGAGMDLYSEMEHMGLSRMEGRWSR